MLKDSLTNVKGLITKTFLVSLFSVAGIIQKKDLINWILYYLCKQKKKERKNLPISQVIQLIHSLCVKKNYLRT